MGFPPPSPPREVEYDGTRYTIVKEGLADILTPQKSQASQNPSKSAAKRKDEAANAQKVFYNPIQQYNRDLSVLAIRAFADDLVAVREIKKHQRGEKAGRKARGKKRKRDEDLSAQPFNGKEANCPEDSSATTSKKEHREAEIGQENGVKNGDEFPKPAAEPQFRILDALSATGLRALRYAKEIPIATLVTANDLLPSATQSIKLNVKHNNLMDRIQPNTADANHHMKLSTARESGGGSHYHVIDLDPYGTAAPFLDAAVQALVDGGLLCVTCTDAGVFASVGYLEKTYSLYGGLPLKGPHAHEGGLRLILHAIATSAARYGLSIEPLLSLSIDFYVRVFVRVHKSAADVKFLAGKTMLVYNCDSGCGAWSTQYIAKTKEELSKNGNPVYRFTAGLGPSTTPECEHCGFKTHLAGPMWAGPLHNPYFIQHILAGLPELSKETYGTLPRLEGMLTTALSESLDDDDLPRSETVPKTETSPLEGASTKEQTPSDPPATSTTTSEPSAPPLQRPIPPLNPSRKCNHPFFIIPSHLSRTLHCISPSDAAFRGALMHLGYKTSSSHTKPGSIITNAPWTVIWEVMREWIRQKHPVKEGAISKGTAGWGVMMKDRSKVGGGLLSAREELGRLGREREGLGELKEGLEALLYRISSAEKSAIPTTDKANGVIGGLAEQQKKSTAQSESVVANSEAISQGPSANHPSTLNIVFDEELGRRATAKDGKKLLRHQINPPGWGPMNRAKGD